MKSLRLMCMIALFLGATASHGVVSHAIDLGSISDGQVVAWTEKRVTDWQPKASERRFDEIGWVKDIRTAERLSVPAPRLASLYALLKMSERKAR